MFTYWKFLRPKPTANVIHPAMHTNTKGIANYVCVCVCFTKHFFAIIMAYLVMIRTNDGARRRTTQDRRTFLATPGSMFTFFNTESFNSKAIVQSAERAL